MLLASNLDRVLDMSKVGYCKQVLMFDLTERFYFYVDFGAGIHISQPPHRETRIERHTYWQGFCIPVFCSTGSRPEDEYNCSKVDARLLGGRISGVPRMANGFCVGSWHRNRILVVVDVSYMRICSWQ